MNNRRTLTGLVTALTFTLAACGGGSTSSNDATPADEATVSEPTTTSRITTIVPSPSLDDEPVAEQPATEQPIAATPAASAEEVTPAAAATAATSPAVTAFADANRDLVDKWSANLLAFGDEAIDHLDDVSKAPAAAAARESSDLMIAAIGPDETDPSLVTVRKFATGMSSAITFADDGDQGAAMSVFIQLQGDSELLTSVLAQLEA